jgi:hypothetical protein
MDLLEIAGLRAKIRRRDLMNPKEDSYISTTASTPFLENVVGVILIDLLTN